MLFFNVTSLILMTVVDSSIWPPPRMLRPTSSHLVKRLPMKPHPRAFCLSTVTLPKTRVSWVAEWRDTVADYRDCSKTVAEGRISTYKPPCCISRLCFVKPWFTRTVSPLNYSRCCMWTGKVQSWLLQSWKWLDNGKKWTFCLIYIYEHCAGGQTFACFDTELTKHPSSTKDELKGPYIYLNGDVIMLKTLTEVPSSLVDSILRPCGVKLHLDPCLFRPKAGQLSQFAVFSKGRGCGPENSRLADVRGPSVGLFLSQTP